MYSPSATGASDNRSHCTNQCFMAEKDINARCITGGVCRNPILLLSSELLFVDLEVKFVNLNCLQ